MSANKPAPLCYRPPPPACPVCGQPSYSVSGVHPQCCIRQHDADRMQRIKQAAALEESHASDAAPGKPRPPGTRRSFNIVKPALPATVTN